MLPSADSITRQVDKTYDEAVKVISADIKEAVKDTRTIHLTSDGGSGVDMKRTKKNTLVAAYVDNNFEMKIDTLQVKPTKEAQTGELLVGEWKEGLEKFDLINDDNDMDENSESSKLQFSMTTDAAPNVRKARKLANERLNFKYDGDCFDHQVNLAIEESTKGNVEMEQAIKIGNKIVSHFTQSGGVAREELRNIQLERGVEKPKEIIRGTENR